MTNIEKLHEFIDARIAKLELEHAICNSEKLFNRKYFYDAVKTVLSIKKDVDSIIEYLNFMLSGMTETGIDKKFPYILKDFADLYSFISELYERESKEGVQ